MSQIPEKPYYKVREVCQYTDTQPYVLRHWESEFPQLNPERNASGQPIYRRRDIDVVMRIKQLLNDEQQSIADARELLEREANGKSSSRSKGTRRAPKAATERAKPAPQLELEASAPEQAPAPEPVEPPAVVHGTGASETLQSVSRERYEGALEEIAHLKLELNDRDSQQRRLEADLASAQDETERLRSRNERAAAVLDRLLGRLTGG